MNPTKIPKPSQVRAPKIVVTRGLVQRVVEPISENKLNMPKPSIQLNQTSLRSFPQPMLRRRSKSATDLRSVDVKPLSQLRKHLGTSNTNLAKTKLMITEPPQSTTRACVKSAADKGKNEEVKPKGAKFKIPDWDYKSRFHVLNEKHSLLQENLKGAKKRLSDLGDLEEKFSALSNEVVKLRAENRSLTECKIGLAKENNDFKSENKQVRSELKNLKPNHEKLTEEHTVLLKKEETNLDTISTLEEEVARLENELRTLQKNHNALEKEHENLNSSHNLLRLEYDTMVRENETLNFNVHNARERIARLESELQNHKGEIMSNEAVRRQLHNTIQDLKGNIRVFCRVRPPVTVDEKGRLLCYINYIDECNLEIGKCMESLSAISRKPSDLKLEFSFDHVFPPESTQEEVFEELAQLIQSALDGFHVCVFAYGQTGSGKTFTMQGDAPDKLGMIPKSIDLIFDRIEDLKKSGWIYTVEASFLEIYNETINDLIEPNSGCSYDIRYNEGKGTTVTNLKIEAIDSADKLKQFMSVAQQNRAVAATDFNEHSSRSHAVTKIYLNGENNESNICYSGSVNLVDLAGSESAKTSNSERLTETKNINKSLSTLGSVILALYNKDPHVPYRNSKLTYLLQSCLGGNSKTLMYVNISPFDECYSESVNSMRFASKVKEIKTGSKRNNGFSSLQPIISDKSI